MSFSSDIKEELSKISNLANKELIKYELIGYLISSNTKILKNNKIKFSTESEYNINRFAKLLKNFDIGNYEIKLNGKVYVILLKIKDISDFVDIEIDKEKCIRNKIDDNLEKSKSINIKSSRIHIKDQESNLIKEDIEKFRSLLKGIFLGAGYINQPENKYHLELNFSNDIVGKYIVEILQKNDIKGKGLCKKNEYSIYIKDGEEISKFFAFIGSNKGVIKFEETRVQREMNNKINRLVNCEAANLNKTMNASIEQIDAIKKLQMDGKFETLDKNLKELALIRLDNPNASLVELGQMLSNPIGKSGVNYRLKKIVEISK